LADVAASLARGDSKSILNSTGDLFLSSDLAKRAASVEPRVRCRELLRQHNYPALQQSLRVGARGNTAALLVATTPTPDPALTATVTTPVPLPVVPIGATNASAAFNDQAPQAAALKVPFLPPSLPPALSCGEQKKERVNNKKTSSSVEGKTAAKSWRSNKPPILRNENNDASRRGNEMKQQVAALELGQEDDDNEL
jgi:hypothetical protein